MYETLSRITPTSRIMNCDVLLAVEEIVQVLQVSQGVPAVVVPVVVAVVVAVVVSVVVSVVVPVLEEIVREM